VGQASFNPDRLKAALDCLLENAVKFTAPGDVIQLIGSGTPDTWTIVVADSGSGMSPGTLAALTADSTAIPAVTASGTGLGMMTVREVVKSWDGRLEIRSEPDVGTTVSLHFARFAPAADPLDAAPGEPSTNAVSR
jgi:signal transduction histidine kinase